MMPRFFAAVAPALSLVRSMLATQSRASQSKAEPPAGKADKPSHAKTDHALNPNWTRLAWSAQPNLAIGPADDALEREADHVAERVMWMPHSDVAVSASAPMISRKAEGGGHAAPSAPPSVFATLATSGRPLDPATRGYFEPRLGVSLDAVRVHDDATAAASASDVSARAYTVGNDIVLAGGSYRHGDPAARTVLAHELVHVLQQSPERPVLQRYPSCSRLLSARDGPFVAEDSVQEYLAEQLEATGDIARELRVPGGSAAPWRTDGRDDTVIDPQNIHEWITGQVDVAMHRPEGLALDFLEVKRASWPAAQFAENQVVNYVDKANDAIPEVERSFRRRAVSPYAIVRSVREMPESTYVPPPQPVDIDGQQVMLAWCRSGVIVFKSLDVDNEELLYCGISDRGRTDAFIGRVLGQAEEAVAQAVMRRLRELFPGGTGSIRPLLDKIREKLQSTIRYLLSETINAMCAAALEISVASLLAEFKKWLWKNNDLVDGLLWKLTPQGSALQLHLGEAAAVTAGALTVGAIIWEIISLLPAFA
jgi:Domain of unknown function (DUF4157)